MRKIMKMFQDHDIDKTARIIGPGPFYCSFCGTKMDEAGHMMEKFYLCPNAGEFTWSPPSWVRVEIDGTSYVVAERDVSDDELKRERGYYEMCVDAHARATELAPGDPGPIPTEPQIKEPSFEALNDWRKKHIG